MKNRCAYDCLIVWARYEVVKTELWGSITTDERLYRLPRYMAGICTFIFLRNCLKFILSCHWGLCRHLLDIYSVIMEPHNSIINIKNILDKSSQFLRQLNLNNFLGILRKYLSRRLCAVSTISRCVSVLCVMVSFLK